MAAAGREGVDEEGWTLVHGRRSASSGRRSPVKETAVAAALRQNSEEKRDRDTRRARLVEKARGACQSPGSEQASDTDQGLAGSVLHSPSGLSGRPSATVSSQSSMGPPPPPQRPRVPPPPLPARSPSGERPPGTPHSAQRPLESPPAPARPGRGRFPGAGRPQIAARHGRDTHLEAIQRVAGRARPVELHVADSILGSVFASTFNGAFAPF